MKKILLPFSGLYALVDDEDFTNLNKFVWGLAGLGYVCRKEGYWKNRKTIYMHREIMKTPVGLDTDHKNLNRLDNRKKNLRICTRSENQHYQRKQNGKYSSRFVGVHLTNRGKWWARIVINQKSKSLGLYDKEEDAARAYNKIAKKLYGKFVILNKF